jgi:hypothetical protein
MGHDTAVTVAAAAAPVAVPILIIEQPGSPVLLRESEARKLERKDANRSPSPVGLVRAADIKFDDEVFTMVVHAEGECQHTQLKALAHADEAVRRSASPADLEKMKKHDEAAMRHFAGEEARKFDDLGCLPKTPRTRSPSPMDLAVEAELKNLPTSRPLTPTCSGPRAL